MARITKETFVCDLCGKQVSEEDYVSADMLVLFKTSEDDGRPCSPKYVRKDLGICWDCLDKTVVVEGSGCMGHNRYQFRRS